MASGAGKARISPAKCPVSLVKEPARLETGASACRQDGVAGSGGLSRRGPRVASLTVKGRFGLPLLRRLGQKMTVTLSRNRACQDASMGSPSTGSSGRYR